MKSYVLCFYYNECKYPEIQLPEYINQFSNRVIGSLLDVNINDTLLGYLNQMFVLEIDANIDTEKLGKLCTTVSKYIFLKIGKDDCTSLQNVVYILSNPPKEYLSVQKKIIANSIKSEIREQTINQIL